MKSTARPGGNSLFAHRIYDQLSKSADGNHHDLIVSDGKSGLQEFRLPTQWHGLTQGLRRDHSGVLRCWRVLDALLPIGGARSPSGHSRNCRPRRALSRTHDQIGSCLPSARPQRIL
jgi:hypothetical protein